MCDYEVLHYGQITGLIIEAINKEDALIQVARTGLKTHNNFLKLVEL